MFYYEVLENVMDYTNGLFLKRNSFVETDELVWINRFGETTFKKVVCVPNGFKITTIKDTKEHLNSLVPNTPKEHLNSLVPNTPKELETDNASKEPENTPKELESKVVPKEPIIKKSLKK